LYIPLACAQAPVAAQTAVSDADRLYTDRANLASATRAADIWSSALLSNPRSFEIAWKLSRADYWLGTHGPEGVRRDALERGVDAGRKAVAPEPSRPHGHFWAAANMGALAESYGMRAGLKYRKPIKEELETVLRIDRGFLDGSADRALGRWYAKVPSLFGGSRTLGEEHLRASLTYDPHNPVSHVFLAELLLDQGRRAEARGELQKAIEDPINPEWAPEDRDFKDRARALLPKTN
jgi:tetratricopeptide (TPR) repeat protein